MIVEETWKTQDFLKLTQKEIKRHKVNVLKSPEHYLGNVGEEKRWTCSDYCQHKVLNMVTQHITQQSLAQVCFQGTSAAPIFEPMLCRGGQMQEQVHTFWPSQECFQLLPLPKRANPLANHSFKNIWLKQLFYESTLKIDVKNWTYKKNNPATLNFPSLFNVVLDCFYEMYFPELEFLLKLLMNNELFQEK